MMQSLLDLDKIIETPNPFADWVYYDKRYDWQLPLGTKVLISKEWAWMWGESRTTGTIRAYHNQRASGGFWPRWYNLEIDGHPIEDGYGDYYLVADKWLTVIEGEKQT